MLRPVIHILLHLLIPAIVARLAYPARWQYVWLLMVATMLVDLDHLLAVPLYDPDRCSIGFHPLHTLPAIVVYIVIFFIPKLRIISVGLLIHMALDTLDCVWMGKFNIETFVTSSWPFLHW